MHTLPWTDSSLLADCQPWSQGENVIKLYRMVSELRPSFGATRRREFCGFLIPLVQILDVFKARVKCYLLQGGFSSL